VDEQGTALASARRHRAAVERQVARELHLSVDTPLHELPPAWAGDYTPLITALAHENAQLASRVRERASEHESLLCQSLDRMHRLLPDLVLKSEGAALTYVASTQTFVSSCLAAKLFLRFIAMVLSITGPQLMHFQA
jgi:hypothetical protein